MSAFVVAFTLVWVACVVAMVMMAWKALPLGGANTARFWRMVLASRPAAAPESTAWWWGRIFAATWLLSALLFLGWYLVEIRGFLKLH